MNCSVASIGLFTEKKFVLLAGPRQVGKTTVAKEWLDSKKGLYLNWDFGEDRRNILKQIFLDLEPEISSILFDEIHKYPRWKNYIKGLYDKEAKRLKVVVTGSAILDLYRKGGDSLIGRYELLRLHPFSIGELTHASIPAPPTNWLNPGSQTFNKSNWRDLLKFGGFPEPLTEKNELHHQRWSTQRRELLIKEDIKDISEIRLVALVEHLYLLLLDRIGSPLSLNSLKVELQVAYNSVSAWISALEKLYICYRISPYHKKLSRSLKKEQKLYLWDWSQVPDPAARFENMVAGHLLKSIHAWNDLGYGEFDLLYWRNKEKQEVDFVITNKRKPLALFECKLSDEKFSKPLAQLSAELGNIPAIQLVATEGVDEKTAGARVVSACTYLANLV